MSKRAVVYSSLVVGLCVVGLALAEEIQSGLKPGAAPQAFNVHNVTGQKCKGITQDDRGVLCYR